MQTSQKVEQVKAYFSAVETSTTHSIKSWTTQNDWASLGWVLAESGRGINTANVTAERKQANQRLEKVPNRVWHLYATLLLENMGKHCREWPAANTIRDQASHSRKQQTARPHSVHWWFSHQRPVRVGLQCQARYDHHPWRQCSLYGLNRQLDNGGGSI